MQKISHLEIRYSISNTSRVHEIYKYAPESLFGVHSMYFGWGDVQFLDKSNSTCAMKLNNLQALYFSYVFATWGVKRLIEVGDCEFCDTLETCELHMILEGEMVHITEEFTHSECWVRLDQLKLAVRDLVAQVERVCDTNFPTITQYPEFGRAIATIQRSLCDLI